MKYTDYKIFTADKPGWMNTKFSNSTVHHRLFIKSSAHNVQHTNNKKQLLKKLFEEDSLMTGNHPDSEVAAEHEHRTRDQNITNREI